MFKRHRFVLSCSLVTFLLMIMYLTLAVITREAEYGNNETTTTPYSKRRN